MLDPQAATIAAPICANLRHAAPFCDWLAHYGANSTIGALILEERELTIHYQDCKLLYRCETK
jgi:hypothetical protein